MAVIITIHCFLVVRVLFLARGKCTNFFSYLLQVNQEAPIFVLISTVLSRVVKARSVKSDCKRWTIPCTRTTLITSSRFIALHPVSGRGDGGRWSLFYLIRNEFGRLRVKVSFRSAEFSLEIQKYSLPETLVRIFNWRNQFLAIRVG